MYHHEQVGRVYITLGLLLIVPFAIGIAAKFAPLLWFTVVFAAIYWAFARLRVDVLAGGAAAQLRWAMTFGWPGGRIPLSDIASAEIVAVTFWMGVGVHLTLRGWVWNVALGKGVRIVKRDGSDVILGTDDSRDCSRRSSVLADDTIAAIATPPGKGAIAIVRVSGPDAGDLVRRLVRARHPLRPRVAALAEFVDETGRLLDRGLALFFPAPESYTGEDLLELHVHGSPIVAREVVRALIACGARQAEPGEFTRRAFLTARWSCMPPKRSPTWSTAETALPRGARPANLGGGFVKDCALRARVGTLLEELAAAIDFPDEVAEPEPARLASEIASLADALDRLHSTASAGGWYARAYRRDRRTAQCRQVVAAQRLARRRPRHRLGNSRHDARHDRGDDRNRRRTGSSRRHGGHRAHADRSSAPASSGRGARSLRRAWRSSFSTDRSRWEKRRARCSRRDELMRVVFFNKADLGAAEPAVADTLGAIVGSVRIPASLESCAPRSRAPVGAANSPTSSARLASVREFAAVDEALDALAAASRTLAAGEPTDFVAGELHRAFAALGKVSERDAAEEGLELLPFLHRKVTEKASHEPHAFRAPHRRRSPRAGRRPRQGCVAVRRHDPKLRREQ